MKRLIIIAIISSIFIGSVSAQELYYKNSNGVSFTKHEYDKISKFYWEGYQENLSKEDFLFLSNNGLFENEIKSIEINNNNFNLLSLEEYTTNNKSLKMNISCSSNCLVSIYLNWLKIPKIKSYDIIGFYLDNTSIINIGNVIVDSGKETKAYPLTNKTENGLGSSFKLPTNAIHLKISQTLLVEKRGNIKASYQHAKKNISYANSKKYTFSSSGIGGVFDFNKGIQDYYDCMNGVSSKLE